MFGFGPFGGFPFGGITVTATGSQDSERGSEITGADALTSNRTSQITGTGSTSDRSSEITGHLLLTSDRPSQITGAGTADDRPSQISGKLAAVSERSSQISGIFDRPTTTGYRIIVKDKNGNALGEVGAFRSVKCSKRLNNYGEAQFNVMVTDPKATDLISLRQNTLEIYRESGVSQTLIWSGEQALSVGDLNAKGDNWAVVHCFTWFEQLMHRYTAEEKVFTNIDQGTIASTLITDTNTDDPTGITIGTVVATKNRDRTYNSYNVAEAIVNLSNVIAGFDFEVTDLKVFNADSILGTDKTNDVILRYGHNITNMTITEDFVNPMNRAIVLGEVVGATTLQRVERDDAGLQTTYGLREGRLQEMNVSGLNSLQDKGDAAIRKFGQPLIRVTFDLIRNITPSIDEFGIGDGIRLIAQWGMYNIDEQYRVFEWELEFDSAGNEKLSLVLGKFITI